MGTRGDILGRVIGMLVFFAGVLLLIWVFTIAYGLFSLRPADALGLHLTGKPNIDPGATTVGAQFGYLLLRIAYLFIMSIAASLISNKGINLYFSSMAGGRPGHREPAPPES